jgi:cardiolipin synthase
MTTVPRSFARQIREYGIPCISFNKFFPILSAMMNNRDHRKILVLDGRIAYTGGINLADEYINKKKRFGVWKDTGIRVQGEAAWSLTVMFLQMWAAVEVNETRRALRDKHAPWGIHSGETVRDILALRTPRTEDKAENEDEGLGACPADGEKNWDGFIQPYFDTPLDQYQTGEDVYLNIINTCTEHLWITTPYLIIDSELTGALSRAARRGVKVSIIMPGIPDKRLIYALSQSYYAPLLEAGVEILEYTPGFIHAKVFEADGKIAVVGTINMDFRALSMHFECGCILYGSSEIERIREDMEETSALCRKVELSECRYGFFRNAALAILQTAAPVL